jgi:O-antigen/teichoic acid export membrane protein
MRSQLAYALPLGFAGLLWGIQLDVHHYFVSNRFGPAVYALYAVGCFELPLVGILRESVGSVMIARVSALRHENNLREIVLLTVEVMRRLAAFFFPVYLFFLVTARDLIALLFRAQYMESWPIFAVNLTLIPLGLIGTAYDPVFRAHPEHRYFVLRTQIVSFLLLLAGLWLGIGHFGLVGAISAVVAVNLVQHLILGARAARILELTWRDLPLFKDIGKLACAGLAAGAVGAGVRELLLGIEPFIVLSVCGAVFALIYLASVYFLKVLSPEELGSIQRAASQLRHGLRKRAAGSLVG